MGGTPKSEILDIANEMAHDLFKVGAMDEITMRQVEALCLPKNGYLCPLSVIRN
jgi:putative transcriptional regulator